MSSTEQTEAEREAFKERVRSRFKGEQKSKAYKGKAEAGADGAADNSSDLDAMIAALTKASTEEEINVVLIQLLSAKLTPMRKDKCELAIMANACISKRSVLTAQIKALQGSEKSDGDFGLEKVADRYEYSYYQEYDIVDARQAVAATIVELNKLAGFPVVSLMGEQPVRLSQVSEKEYTVSTMGEAQLWAYASEHLSFIKKTKDFTHPRAQVPRDIITQFFHEGGKKYLPRTPMICKAPCFRSDGALIISQKYHHDAEDPESLNHLMAYDFEMPEVPEAPTKADAVACREWLVEELLNDFPFWDEDENGVMNGRAGLANSLGMIITPFMRKMIKGRTPGWLVTKPRGGTGGSLLGVTPSLITDGCDPKITNYTEDEAEMTKTLTTTVLSGTNYMFFDDVPSFRGQILLRYLTAEYVGGRQLGSNSDVSVPNEFNYIITSNNITVDEQMDRRLVYTRLNPRTSNMQNRKFRYGGQPKVDPDGNPVLDEYGKPVHVLTLREFILANRGLIISKILTIIQFWINEGEPRFTVRRRVGFEDWVAKVGGVLESVGVEGFLCGKSGVRASAEMVEDQAFIEKWFDKYGKEKVVFDDLLKLAKENGLTILKGKFDADKQQSLQDALRRLDGNTFPIEKEKCEFTLITDAAATGAVYRLQKEHSVVNGGNRSGNGG